MSHHFSRYSLFAILLQYRGLTVSGATESALVPSCLGLLFVQGGGGNIAAGLCGGHDTFGFRVVGFPFVSGSVLLAPAYGVCVSRLVRCVRCCWGCGSFLLRRGALVAGPLSQGYRVSHLSSVFGGFYGEHTGLVGQCGESVCQMFAGSVGWGGFFFMDLPMLKLIKLAQMAGVVRGADRGCSVRGAWWLHRLAADVPFVACVVDLPCTFALYFCPLLGIVEFSVLFYDLDCRVLGFWLPVSC